MPPPSTPPFFTGHFVQRIIRNTASSRHHLPLQSQEKLASAACAPRTQQYFSTAYPRYPLLARQRQASRQPSAPPRRDIITTPDTTMPFENYEQMLQAQYPAKDHALRSVKRMQENGVDANGIFYFESTVEKLQEDNDGPEHFRQRRFFYYLTGCNMANCQFIFDIQASRSYLFIPPVVDEEVIWSGLPTTVDDALKYYNVDEVRHTSQVNDTIAELAAKYPDSTIYTIDDQVSESIDITPFKKRDTKSAKTAVQTCRVVKDEYEIAMIRKANYISCLGHEAAMARVKTAKTESELEAAFRERCISHGAKEVAYHPIVAAGSAAATLHYVDNTKPLDGKLNVLIDAGCEWNNYASDITRTFPINGKFTEESRNIYNIVLKMNEDTTNGLKGGVLYDDLHVQAHKIAIDGLLELGILKGNADEIFAARTSTAFFPHGLGHHLGMDCHDTGGNPNREDKDKLFPNLRLRGTVPTGSIVTIEPGIYFCEFIIKPFLSDPVHSKFIDSAVLDKYWAVGGVRLEDNILVTEDGSVNLTTTPKAIAEVEALSS